MDDDGFEDIFSERERDAINKAFVRLQDTCYLDHTGSALYTETHIKSVANDLCSNIFGNPHSNSSTSKLCSDLVDQVRYRILQYFGTDSDEYTVVFTSGATGAIKLVAESFLWNNVREETSTGWSTVEETTSKCRQDRGGEFVYMEDNHTSVLGMRDLVVDQGASKVRCLSYDESLRLFSDNRTLRIGCKPSQEAVNSLFVYSAQCNFSGVKNPLSWIQKVHSGILEQNETPQRSNWYCLLDAATFVSTNRLNLSLFKPDFVSVSFYKLFGYPTGLGALLVRNCCSEVLGKRYYGGGTVLIALSACRVRIPRPILHERLEDGTINFLSIISLQHGFNSFEGLVNSVDKVSLHTFGLAKYVFKRLSKLRHSNGSPVAILYADSQYDDINVQGNIVNFNILRSSGEYVGYAEVLHVANLRGIQLRTGCFCNPGACRRHLSLSVEDLGAHYKAGHVCGDDNDLVNGRPTGSVRVSFGYYNTKADADKLVSTIEENFCEQKLPEFIKLDISQSARYIYHWFSDRYPLLDVSGRHFKKSQLSDPSKKNEPFLSHIFIYPVKSCGKFPVNSWELDSSGLMFDRAWMIIDENGVALTQKREPKLCLIRPIIDLTSHNLHLTFRGIGDCTLSLTPANTGNPDGRVSKVCGDRVCGLDCGKAASDWLQKVLGRPGLILLRQMPSKPRISTMYKPGSLSLANQAQYLLINQSSIQWLSENLENESNCSKESLLDRFRSNFVVSGVDEPLSELVWSQVNIGSVGFKVDGPCRRCQMVCVDQGSGELTKEPLTTLYRLGGGKLMFGVYLSALGSPSATISVGDSVTFQ